MALPVSFDALWAAYRTYPMRQPGFSDYDMAEGLLKTAADILPTGMECVDPSDLVIQDYNKKRDASAMIDWPSGAVSAIMYYRSRIHPN
jgi:hypothetical protein